MQFYALALFEIMCRVCFRYNAYYKKHGCDFVNLAILNPLTLGFSPNPLPLNVARVVDVAGG